MQASKHEYQACKEQQPHNLICSVTKHTLLTTLSLVQPLIKSRTTSAIAARALRLNRDVVKASLNVRNIAVQSRVRGAAANGIVCVVVGDWAETVADANLNITSFFSTKVSSNRELFNKVCGINCEQWILLFQDRERH